MMRRRRFLAATTSAASLTGAGAASSCGGPRNGPEPIGLATARKALPRTASLTAVRPAEFRILQITDVHFFFDRERLGGGPDEQTAADLVRLVERFEPDLLAVTGDLWHDNPGGRGEEFLAFGLERITALDRPWFFTWGNHDLLDDYASAQSTLTEAPGSLYRGGRDGGNYLIRLQDGDGRPLWDLLCLNTTTRGMQEPQEKWLRHRIETLRDDPSASPVAALAFFHIPLFDYELMWQDGDAAGIREESVCSDGEDGSAIGVLAEAGVRACFCGHDHMNDYGGLRRGIELVYGRATGHAGYGGDQVPKGAKLIRLDGERGQWQWETVFPDGNRWRPS